MKLLLIRVRDSLAESFWFLPALMALLSAVAALASVALDHVIGTDWVRNITWFWSGGADGARGVLSVIAGSIMTVVSIVFSLTITTLAQTSSQFGPRVLRNFTSDRGVQFTLGTFIATFIYCLLVLRTVRSVEESVFVPYLSVNLGILLALASLAILIYFIHHIAQNIQAENLVAAVGLEIQKALDVLFPERVGASGKDAPSPPGEYWSEAQGLESNNAGYVLQVDEERVIALAVEHDLQIYLDRRPGDFVTRGGLLLHVLSAAEIDDGLAGDLRACFSLGRRRTPYQDVLYSFQQLVEIGTHALSPGINEPFTALSCIDWLGNALRCVATRDMPHAARLDEAGRLRVVARPVCFEEIAATTFTQFRIFGASNPDILSGLLGVIASIAPALQRETDRQALIHHARLIGEDSNRVNNPVDRERVICDLSRTLDALHASKP